MSRRLTMTGNESLKTESGVNKGLIATEPVLRKTPKTGERKKSLMPMTDRRTSMVPTESSMASRPSITGLLASRRLSKRLFQKYHKDDDPTHASSTALIAIEQEPTYKMAPEKKFNPSEVEKIIKSVIYSTFNGMKYSPKLCCTIMKVLSDDIKKQVKDLNYPRYKIVCVLVVGEAKDACASVTSRCTWDPKSDTFASYTFKSNHLWCTGTVYGIYQE